MPKQVVANSTYLLSSLPPDFSRILSENLNEATTESKGDSQRAMQQAEQTLLGIILGTINYAEEEKMEGGEGIEADSNNSAKIREAATYVLGELYVKRG